jgi:hypothetical protein
MLSATAQPNNSSKELVSVEGLQFEQYQMD